MPPMMRPPMAPPSAKTPAATKPVIQVMEPKFLPPRIVINAVEGWGKTTLGAYAPHPLMLMTHGETGYQTLLGSGLAPAIPAAVIDSWPGFLALLDDLAAGCEYKTVVIDALNGLERLCHEHVCVRDYKGDWSEKGFFSYMKGPDSAVTDWIGMLSLLDRIRAGGTMIVILGHVQVKNFKNPLGPDYDRFVSDVNAKTWSVTHKWSDAVLFGNFLTVVEEDSSKRKRGIGGDQRVLYTQRTDAYDAKNRYSMKESIYLTNDPSQNWPTVWDEIIHKGE